MPLNRTTSATRPIREAGGDNEVPRDKLGRPRIVIPCPKGCTEGRVPSEKRAGSTVQCSGCLGKGHKLKSYTRTTTFIDVIEDKSKLMEWKARLALVGAALDPTLLDGVLAHFDSQNNPVGDTPDEVEECEKKAKDWLNRRAESSVKKAGGSVKAEKGTELHGFSELVDQGIALPDEVTFEDVLDLDAYKRATFGLVDIVHMERLMVLDEFGVGGTPDRISTIKPGVVLEAPDGHIFDPDEPIITDLKTGTVAHGQLKMAMQLAIYSRSKLYDWRTGGRSDIARLNQQWGIIMNVPAGSGECQLLWADLTMGWKAVRIAREIRQLRTEGKQALTPFVHASAA